MCVCACVLVTKLQISGRVIELGGMCTMSRTADSVRIPQSTTFLVVWHAIIELVVKDYLWHRCR